MNWIEKRDADYLTVSDGKVVGKVTPRGSVHAAYAVYSAGGSHGMELGDYISLESARAAVELHVRTVNLAGTT